MQNNLSENKLSRLLYDAYYHHSEHPTNNILYDSKQAARYVLSDHVVLPKEVWNALLPGNKLRYEIDRLHALNTHNQLHYEELLESSAKELTDFKQEYVDGALSAQTTPVLRTDASGCGSWPTAQATDGTNGGPNSRDSSGRPHLSAMAQWPTPDAALGDGGKVSRGGARKDEALLAGMAKWPTPDANAMNLGESPESWDARRETLRAKHGNGNGAGRVLAVEASRWATPRSCSAAAAAFTDDAIAKAGERFPNLESQVQLATWSTPQARDEHTYAKTKRGANSPGGTPLTVQAVESRAWPTPGANEDAAGRPGAAMQPMLGNHPDVRTQGSLALHPDWVEALMGWPLLWTSLAPMLSLLWPALHGAQVSGPGQPQHPWEPPRVASGIKNRAKRLRCIGNGQHPFAAALAWRVLTEGGRG